MSRARRTPGTNNMKEKIYNIMKEGHVIDTITRAGEVTILDAALGVAYSETEANFLAYIKVLTDNGYSVAEEGGQR